MFARDPSCEMLKFWVRKQRMLLLSMRTACGHQGFWSRSEGIQEHPPPQVKAENRNLVAWV